MTNVSLEVRGSSIDNFYYSDVDKRSAAGLRISPRISFQRDRAAVKSSLLFSGEGATYSTDNADNYFDTDTSAQLKYLFGRSAIALDLAYKLGHDPLGTVRTEGANIASRDLDEWQLGAAGLVLQISDKGAASFFSELEASVAQQRYQTNRAQTRILDRDAIHVDWVIGYRLTQKTGIILNALFRDDQFTNEATNTPTSRSGQIVGLLGGVQWKASARSHGDIRLGSVTRKSDDARRDIKTSYWRVSLNWNPTYLDELELSTTRVFEESYLLGSGFFITDTSTLKWQRNWNRTITSLVSLTYANREIGNTPDEDELGNVQVELNKQLDRDFSVFASFVSATRDSTRPGLEFDRNEIALGFRAKLN